MRLITKVLINRSDVAKTKTVINTKYKIVVLMNSISRDSGGLSSALDVAETLYKIGYDVKIVLTNSHLLYKVRNRHFRKTIVPLSRICTVPHELIEIKGKQKDDDPFKFASLKGYIKMQAKGLLQLIEKTDSLRKKNYEILKDADVIFCAVMLSGKSFAKLRQISNAKIIYNHAGSPETFEDYWLNDSHVLKSVNSKGALYKDFCKRYDGILFQADDQARACIKRNPDIAERCYVLNPSCQEEKVLSARQSQRPYCDRSKIIVCVGFIQPRKAQHLAIEAFSKLIDNYKNVQLHFIGGGIDTNYGSKLLKEVNRLDLKDFVFFHGHRRDYLNYMAHADVLVQSSESEGVSRILREAMLLALPIVSFAISGTRSLLKNKKDALLVKPYNTDDMAEAMEKLLNYPDLGKELAKSANQNYLLNNSWCVYAANMSRIINSIIK